MFTRISNLLLLGLLASCGRGDFVPDKAEIEGGQEVACATGGSTEIKPVCALERQVGEDGLILTMHHPDGGFRRLAITTDGRGVVSADGSEEAVITPVATSLIEVAVAGDRYQLPATVRR
jgi:hypothetical protein